MVVFVLFRKQRIDCSRAFFPRNTAQIQRKSAFTNCKASMMFTCSYRRVKVKRVLRNAFTLYTNFLFDCRRLYNSYIIYNKKYYANS